MSMPGFGPSRTITAVRSMVLGKCSNEGCRSEIETAHITQTINIPKSPQFVALAYKCHVCGKRDKIVLEEKEWESKKALGAARGRKRKRDARLVEVEMAGVETAQDLINIWAEAKNPPLIEELRGKCNCPSCRKKWNDNA